MKFWNSYHSNISLNEMKFLNNISVYYLLLLFDVSIPIFHQYGGISIECQETETAMVTTLTHYKDGMAAVLIINHTERCDLKFNQRYAKPFYHVSRDMRFSTMWYVRPAKPQISLRIRTV